MLSGILCLIVNRNVDNKNSGSYSVKGHFKDLHAHLHKIQYELL